MRVIAGIARRLPLKTIEGLDTRPTTDRIKETLFNMIQHNLCDCIFVDLFSGSGGIGIEALSRGAKKVYFVENNPKAIVCIHENLTTTKLKENSVILKQDAISSLSYIKEREVDIIFMDPPYDQLLEKKMLTYLKDMEFVTENTLIIIEASIDTDLDYANELGFHVIKEKKYKTNKHFFLEKC